MVVVVQERSLSRMASDDVGIDMPRVVLFPYFVSMLIRRSRKWLFSESKTTASVAASVACVISLYLKMRQHSLCGFQ